MKKINSSLLADMRDPLFFEDIPVRVRLSARRSTSIRISPARELIVAAPYGSTEAGILKILSGHRGWILKKIEELDQMRDQSRSNPPLTEQEIKNLRHAAARLFSQRASFFAAKLGVTYSKITVRIMKGRWGSCTSRGGLCFNLALLLAPPEVLDSVVAHEICHLVEANHSDRFYQLLRRLYPEYDIRHRWLKKNGNLILHRFYPELY